MSFFLKCFNAGVVPYAIPAIEGSAEAGNDSGNSHGAKLIKVIMYDHVSNFFCTYIF